MYKTFRQLASHIRQNISAITWIDRDKGQLDDPENFNSILIPGVLIDFGKINWKGESRDNQFGEGSVTFKLVFRLPPASHEWATGQSILWNEFDDSGDLPDWLYDALFTHPAIGDRRSSADYFTGEFYVSEQTFDLRIYHNRKIRAIPKPPPIIDGSFSTTLTIQQ